jgi:hypothetical protein
MNRPPTDDEPKPGSPSTSWPSHNYWMYDERGDFIYKYEFDMIDHPDCEFLENTDYEDKWAKQQAWTVDQAAALSFGRSPDKVPFDYLNEMDGSSEFATILHDLRDRIQAALHDGSLPIVIPAKAFVEWAIKNDLPFPPGLEEQVKTFAEDATRVEEEDLISEGADFLPPALQPQPKQEAANDAPPSNTRKERNLRGLIYALAWKHHRFGDLSAEGVAANIRKVVDHCVEENPNLKIEASSQRIADWLRESVVSFGDPKKYEGSR